MSTIITYNNIQIPSPTPFVELNRDLVFIGDKWENIDKIKLNGQLTGNFNQLTGAQQNLINIFSKNFGTFEISESSSEGYPFEVKISGAGTASANTTYIGDGKGWLFASNGNFLSQEDEITWFLNISGDSYAAYSSFGLLGSQYLFKNWFIENNPPGLPPTPTGTANYYQKIYQKSGIIIDSISFDNSVYNGILNYTIDLRSKDSKYNVENPVNEFSFSEDETKILNLSHRISAQGINTSSTSKSNALDNAINFVRLFSGINNVPAVKFINQTNNNYYLKDIKESINRLNSTYSIEETYSNDLSPYAISGGILRYTVDINSGAQSNVTEIKIQGDFTGPNFGQISDLRSNLNITGLLKTAYSGYINPIPLSYNITENSGENKISFDYSFDNIPLPNPYFDYKVDVSRDELSQITNININAEIIARGNRQNRYNISLSNLDSFTGNFLSIAQSGLAQYNYLNDISNTYNLRLINIQVDKNPNEGKITASAKYDDKSLPASGFSDGSFSVSVNAPYWYMKPNATCNLRGYYIIQDFDILTLPKESISLDLTTTNDPIYTEAQFKNIVQNLSTKIESNDYDFNFVSQEQTDINKKYNKSESLYKISYNIEKIATENNNQLLPKFK